MDDRIPPADKQTNRPELSLPCGGSQREQEVQREPPSLRWAEPSAPATPSCRCQVCGPRSRRQAPLPLLGARPQS